MIRAFKFKKFAKYRWLVFILTLVISILALRYMSMPYVWMLLVWGLFFFLLFLTAKKTAGKVACFNIALLVFLLGCLEFAFSDLVTSFLNKSPLVIADASNQKTKQVEFVSTSDKAFYYRHPVLGYAPTPNNVIKHNEAYSDGHHLQATYTINSDGLRIACPPAQEEKIYDESVIFFGCSFTFGEAVNDDETLPYLFGKYSDWNYRVYNFGFEGYGPHQMLAALKNGIVTNIVQESPKVIVYHGIMDHVYRVAGGHSWIKYGPKYALQNGDLVQVGHFDDDKTPFVERQLLKSFVYKKIADGLSRKMLSEQEAAELLIEIVTASGNNIKQLYPDSEFIVLLWDKWKNEDPALSQCYDQIIDQLRKEGISVHEVKSIIPTYAQERDKFLVRNNGHPNPLAYDKIAEFISKLMAEE